MWGGGVKYLGVNPLALESSSRALGEMSGQLGPAPCDVSSLAEKNLATTGGKSAALSFGPWGTCPVAGYCLRGIKMKRPTHWETVGHFKCNATGPFSNWLSAIRRRRVTHTKCLYAHHTTQTATPPFRVK